MIDVELKNLFPDVDEVFCMDASYAKPTDEWLNMEFGPYFQKFLDTMQVGQWTEQWDCNKFARMYQMVADSCHARTQKRTEAGLAIGVYCYARTGGERHAINVAVTDLGIKFVEPQTQKIITLTDDEKWSAFYILF